MMDKIILGQYADTGSVIHRLDPRTKLLSILAIMISFLLLKTFAGYIATTVLVAGLILTAKLPVVMVFRGLKPILFILSFTFLYHVLLTDGTPLWPGFFLKVTLEGIKNGSFIVWRMILLILLASVLTLTTKPLDLAKGLEKLLKPLSRLGVPVEAFALMIVLAIRFIPTIIQELDRIMLARKARGYDTTYTKGYKKIVAYTSILIPLFVTTIQRAEQLTLAIDARAYGDGRGRTSYKELNFAQVDYVAGGLTLAFVSLILYL
ncbi:energy-coupling factor transporter transmembrane component T family protein [Paenibacillus agri]|uniref:Energy-coupling factor transporter transmembrane protein EcfT n=1 Tax=Paenibacillus agri TaxID=2744309 RepID=A0A850EJ63_9BACL|nr:energy-coupling factor transporter transmembrane component T [Paenibacillus agri]NUU60416.1 energy-coupling factor transporter transmembrane protein EcfT [Paenibacillus agri]